MQIPADALAKNDPIFLEIYAFNPFFVVIPVRPSSVVYLFIFLAIASLADFNIEVSRKIPTSRDISFLSDKFSQFISSPLLD